MDTAHLGRIVRLHPMCSPGSGHPHRHEPGCVTRASGHVQATIAVKQRPLRPHRPGPDCTLARRPARGRDQVARGPWAAGR